MQDTTPKVTVSRKGEDRIAAGHPWIFASDVTNRGGAQPGDAVHVVSTNGRALGTAHYSSTSQITLRLLSRKMESIDRAFFLNRFHRAAEHRTKVVRDSDAYRLIHAEGDLLPGLIVDRYGDCLAVQFLDQGMDRAAGDIVSALDESAAPAFDRGARTTWLSVSTSRSLWRRRSSGESLPAVSSSSSTGCAGGSIPLAGQKTGVYLDQRENYQAAEHFAEGRALDCFTSTGGFALHLARCCDHVEAVDSSAPALELARANGTLNGIGNVEFREANVFDLLSGYASAQRQFETIVLDPPAFAKSKASLDAAARGYKDINYKALRLLAPGGVLVTCSCSHHFSEADLLETVASAALDAEPDPAGPGAADPGSRPSHSVGGPGNPLPEVSGSRGAIKPPDRHKLRKLNSLDCPGSRGMIL